MSVARLSVPRAGEYLALGSLPLAALPVGLLLALLVSLLGLELVFLIAALALGDDFGHLVSILCPLLGRLCLLKRAWLGGDALKLIASPRRRLAIAVRSTI